MYQKRVVLLMVGALALALASCSDSKPSKSLVLEQVKTKEPWITTHDAVDGSDKYFEIRHLAQTNGMLSDPAHYKAHVEFDLYFVDTCDKWFTYLRSEVEKEQNLALVMAIGILSIKLHADIGFSDCAKGSTFHVGRDYDFIKTDNGWQIQ